MGVGAGVAALLLRGLGWFLFAIAALIAGLTLIRFLGFQAIPPALTDVGGAAAFALAGIASRWLARRFESVG